jgi:hypothetical protein
MKEGIRIGCLFLLILGIQAIVFYNIDPLGYPDAIRYINFAEFLQHPQAAHYGDLAHNNGILFTPLFLPVFLAVLKKFASFPYILSGTILQIISFQLILWLAYSIALCIGCKNTARLTLILLLTNLVFCFRSVFILTEYPFTAVLLFIVFYVIKNDIFTSKKAIVLSLLFGLLVSIRIQGLLFMAIIALYLLSRRKIGFGRLAILCFMPFAYLLFHFCFYRYLNNLFPSTITINEIFSMNSFSMGGNFAKYNFSMHGPEALAAQKALSYGSHGLIEYVSLVVARILEFVQFLNATLRHHYIFFTALTCIALILSKVREKALLVALILINFVVTILLLTPFYAVLRYQTCIFPLVIILIASCFVRAPAAFRKAGLGRDVLLFTLFLYAGYYIMYHYDFFRAFAAKEYGRSAILRKEAVNSARLIADKAGHGHYVAASDTMQYNAIYRSGNVPVYFYDGWEGRELSDYIKIRHIRYFIGQHETIDRIKAKGLSTRVICPIFGTYDNKHQTFLCEFKIG